MLRSLLLLLVVLASSAAPQVRGVAFRADEIRAAQLASAQVATLDKGSAKSAKPIERVPPPPVPPPPPSASSFRLVPASFELLSAIHVVFHQRAPRVLPVARDVARRDQRPAIRRLRHRAPSLDTASSNA